MWILRARPGSVATEIDQGAFQMRGDGRVTEQASVTHGPGDSADDRADRHAAAAMTWSGSRRPTAIPAATGRRPLAPLHGLIVPEHALVTPTTSQAGRRPSCADMMDNDGRRHDAEPHPLRAGTSPRPR